MAAMTQETSRSVLQTIGNYDLIEKIAEGGMGSIYRARHHASGAIVAIKIMPPSMAGNPVLLKRFEQEFRAASRLDHPNIVRALDYGESGSMPYLVMEYVDGDSLGQKIEREGRLPEQEAIRLIAQVAQGLHRAHKQGLIHRDVKPDNILMTSDGQAKLADLGLVKEVDADLNLTKTGRGLGTPHFMAPEQFRNAKNADVRCDIYSLGATLYMMVTGELPFKSTGPLDAWMKKIHNELVPPRKLVTSLSERLDWAIRRAMHPDPDQRPVTCREFVEDLTGHSTRRGGPVDTGTAQDMWYLVYRDEDGVTHTVKGTTSAIRRSLKEGLLGDAGNVRAGRSKGGPFEALRAFPEFRDLVLSSPSTSNQSTRPTATGQDTNPRQAVVTQSPPSGSASFAVPAPMIQVQPPEDDEAGGPLEWLKWLLLFFVALGSAVLAWYFFFRRQG
jgi:eukaryotic-like serine/threonine-protein kinase